MRRPWAGVIALLHTDTTDGRRVNSVRWSLSVPVLLESGPDYSPTLVGAVTWIGTDEDTVFASGWVDIDSDTKTGICAVGRHPCGIDLVDAVADMSEDQDVMTVSGRIAGLTIYRAGSGSHPAWPDCHIEVVEQ